MSYGWTKKYQSVTIDDLIKMLREDKLHYDNRIIYFKYVIRDKLGYFERRSNIREDKDE